MRVKEFFLIMRRKFHYLQKKSYNVSNFWGGATTTINSRDRKYFDIKILLSILPHLLSSLVQLWYSMSIQLKLFMFLSIFGLFVCRITSNQFYIFVSVLNPLHLKNGGSWQVSIPDFNINFLLCARAINA